MSTRASAFGPATVANVCAGFDLLGFAMAAPGDTVTARRVNAPGVTIEAAGGIVVDLPRDPARNTAGVAAISLLRAAGDPFGVSLAIDKGIPLGSGMGGSAASAVAAAVAVNRLLPEPLSPAALLPHAAAGEAAASGAAHADNAAPCLHGGLVAVVRHEPPRVVSLPVPPSIRSVVVRPELTIETRAARAALPASVPLGTHVRQSMALAGLIHGCHVGEIGLIGDSLVDVIAEPARKGAIDGFDVARRAALDAGALGFGIAGSGPSVFAWCEGDAVADVVGRAVVAAFAARGLEAAVWCGPLDAPGARVVDEDG